MEGSAIGSTARYGTVVSCQYYCFLYSCKQDVLALHSLHEAGEPLHLCNSTVLARTAECAL